MNIADKTLQLKKDFDDVYKAGQSSMVDESKIIEKTVSGEYISVDDVSEIPHEVKVKLTSGGKNLWSKGDTTLIQASTYDIKLYAGITYTMSAVVTSDDTDNTLCLIYDLTNDKELGCLERNIRSSITFTPTADIYKLYMYAGRNYPTSAGDTATFSDIMIEENDTATEYEPYKETLTDYSGVSLTRVGNNLIPYPYNGKTTANSGLTFTENNGVIIVNGTATVDGAYAILSDANIPVNGTYTMSGISEGSATTIYIQPYIDNVAKTIVTTSPITYEWSGNLTRISMFFKKGATLNNLEIKPMLNFGSTALPYESYNSQTLTANADGTVEGVKSTSPYMYMTTDNQNVTVNATYWKSYGMQTEYDRFWDTFQDKGNRTDYSSAFRGDYWKDEIFKPKYTLQPINADSMFIRTKITDIRMVDLTKATNVGNLCNSSTQGIRYVGKIGNSSIETFGSVFGWCHKLISVEKMIVGAKAQFNNAFEGCYDLESITFEGTIAYNISFAGSSKLNKASILSVFNALSTTSTGKTLTLSTTAVINAFGSTTATEWTSLVATKTNWTISLV